MKNETQNEETNKEATKEETTNSDKGQAKENDTPKEQVPPMRQIIIEFDNKTVNLKALEVSSRFELQGIFDSILRQIN